MSGPIVLGIESTCDETAASVVQNNLNGLPKSFC